MEISTPRQLLRSLGPFRKLPPDPPPTSEKSLQELFQSRGWLEDSRLSYRAHTNGGVQQRMLLRRVHRRVLETAFEKVLRRVLRRCLAVGFDGKKGSEKGSEKGS